MNKKNTLNPSYRYLISLCIICILTLMKTFAQVTCTNPADAGDLVAVGSVFVCEGAISPVFKADYSAPDKTDPRTFGTGEYQYFWLLTQQGNTQNDIVDFVKAESTAAQEGLFTGVQSGEYCVHGISVEIFDHFGFPMANYTTVAELVADINAGNICADIDSSACIPFQISDCPVTVSEPCSCRQNPLKPAQNGNATTFTNGQFDEEVTVEAPSGQSWFIRTVNDFFRPSSSHPPMQPFSFQTGASGQVLTEIPVGNGKSKYVLEGIHKDEIGYEITLENQSGIQRKIQRTVCYYPEPEMLGWNWDKTYCEFSGQVDITGQDKNGGVGLGTFNLYKGSTLLTTTFGNIFSFDPAQLGFGNFELEFIFDALAPAPNDITNPGGTQTVSQNFKVVDTPVSMACNDGIWVSLGQSCEAEITPDFMLEGSYGCYDDYEVTLYRNGWEIPTSPIATSANIGQTLTAKVMHLPSGNKCWGAIGISDRIRPEIHCGGPFVLDCTEDPATVPEPTATDGCDASPQIIFISEGTQLDACGTTIITRTYKARDFRGNVSAPCTQEIQIKQAEVVFPEDISWTCDQYAAFPNIVSATALHTCLKDPSLDAKDDIVGIDPFQSYMDGEDFDVPLLPDFDDDVDNPLTDPVPNTGNFSTIGTPSGETDSYNGTDNDLVCNLSTNYQPIYDTLINNLPHIPDTFLIPNYPILDGAGLPLRGLEDADILELTGSGVPNVQGTACPYNITFSDQIVEACPGQGTGSTFKILRTWTLFNWCTGVVTTDIQAIKVLDDKDPIIVFDDYEDVLTADQYEGFGVSECASSGRLDVPAVYDNCSGIAEIRVFTPAGEGNPVFDTNGAIVGFRIPPPYLKRGTHEVTYQVTDGCGNMTTAKVDVTVIDGIPPVPVCRELTQISLTIDDVGTFVTAESFDEGSYDNCGEIYFKVRRLETTCPGYPLHKSSFHDEINFCCEDIGDTTKIIVRVYDVNPGTGKVSLSHKEEFSNECEIEVLVSDYIRPDCIPPADVWTTCKEVPDNADLQDTLVLQNLFGDAAADDNCQAFTHELPSIVSLDFCGAGTVIRTFGAVDIHGNQSVGTCRQTIMIQPVIEHEINFPGDYQIDCMMPMADTMTYTEIGCDLLAKNIEDLDFIGTPDGACKKILRTYRVINWCTYDGWSDPAQLPRLDLNNDGDYGDAYSVISDGDNIYLNSISNNNVLAAATGYVEYTQHIKVYDGEAPVLSAPSGLQFCGGDKDEDPCTGYVSLMPNIVELCTPDYLVTNWKLDIYADGSFEYVGSDSLTGRYVLGHHKAKFNVSDDCGNRSEIIIEFDIIDCKAPTPVCHNGLSVDLMSSGMVEIWASDFNASSYDYCHDLKFRLNRVTDRTGDGFITSDDYISTAPNTDSVQFTCTDLGTIQTVQLWVGEVSTDGINDWDFCTTWIEIQDNFHNCGNSKIYMDGNIKMENNVSVGNVMVEVSGGTSPSMMTSSDGNFSFDDLEKGLDFTITPHRNDDHTAGISTLDIIYIQRHLLNVEPLDSPYKIIAADANKSNSVSTLDIIALRKIILRIEDEFPGNTAWRFVPKDYVFPNPENPWQTGFPEVKSYNNVDSDMMNTDFIAVKIGDVNLDIDPNNASKITNRTGRESLCFLTKNQKFKSGDRVEVKFEIENIQSLSGFQFTVNFNSQIMAFEEIKEGMVSSGNFGLTRINEGVLTVSWNSSSKINIENAEMFSLVFTTEKAGELKDNIRISSEYTIAEVYKEDGEKMNPELKFESEQNGKFFVSQNTPNPFSEFTKIKFELPRAAPVELTVFAPSGKVIDRQLQIFEPGENSFEIDARDFESEGIYFYRIQSGGISVTEKMIFVKRE